ncbi:MAG: trypsin-like serine protease [Candidatus Electrothrix aestuarii]|uniref:Trypsin-like serine protease n=1 Tax=Candidatus Electrothrix aestuarii TaxID=3062594 RepID=A0AAU8LQ69_9BACT|nr:trypsin-like serine protease [Candidatus Electrothrix aestuarii]
MSKNYLLLCVGFYAALFILFTNHDVFAVADGEATFDYPQIGALLKFDADRRLNVVCSGTLIGAKSFLTAAHCVCGGMNPGVVGSCDSNEKQEGCTECNPVTDDYRAFFQGIGIKAIEDINIAPNYGKKMIGDIAADSDYATILLKEDVAWIKPAELASENFYNTVNDVSIAGFGAIKEFDAYSSTINGSYGIKRYGKSSISECIINEDEETHYEEAICIKKNEEDSGVCSIDSGGPVFLKKGNGNIEIIGIEHGPVTKECDEYGAINISSSVYYYKSKIDRGSISYNEKFSLVPVRQCSGYIDNCQKKEFRIAYETSKIFVTVNGTDDTIDSDWRNNYEILLDYKNGSSIKTIDCENQHIGTFKSCVVENPQQGDWTTKIRKRNGPGGEVQLMVTALVDKSLADSLRSECNFLDLPKTSPYRKAIKKLCELGVLNGVRDLIFEPDKFVNRAEFSKMSILTAEQAGIQFHDQEMNTFPDVIKGSWYEEYVQKLANKPVIINNEKYGHVIEGHPDGEFKPDDFISMPAMIKMVMQIFFPVTPNSRSWNLPFYRWYTPFLKGAQELPITPIFDRGEFTPVMAKKNKYHLHTKDGDIRFATRKEAAKALYDAYQLYISKK